MAERGRPAAAIVRTPASLDLTALPAAVALLRGRILQAASGGDVEDLRVPLGWNEVPPLFRRGQPAGFDSIAYLRLRSFDGQGREMLRILRAVFTAAYVRETRGPSVSYLWPVFPVTPERAPSTAERLAPWTCVRFADLAARGPDGTPLIHRASIGEDGTWHTFWTEPAP